MTVLPTGNHDSLVVLCGPFIGLAETEPDFTGDAVRREERLHTWAERWADVTASHPIDPNAPVFDDSTVTLAQLLQNKAPEKVEDEDKPAPRPTRRSHVVEADDDEDQVEDEPPAEVESLPMLDDDGQPVEEVQLPDATEESEYTAADELRVLAETAAQHFWMRQGGDPQTTSGVGLKQLLQIGHAKASAVLDILIAAGAVEGGDMNPPRARRVLIGEDIHIDLVVRRLRGASS